MEKAERPSVAPQPERIDPVPLVGIIPARENPFNKVEPEPDWLGDDMGPTF